MYGLQLVTQMCSNFILYSGLVNEENSLSLSGLQERVKRN